MKWAAPARAIGGCLVFLAVWESVVDTGLAHFEYLPPPSKILLGMGELFGQDDALGDIVHTLISTLLGWVIALSAGFTLGCALGLSTWMRLFSMTTVDILRPIPAVALVPIGLLLFGFSVQTELFVIILPCIWPVLVNTMIGIQTAPVRLRDVGKVMRLSIWDRVFKILLPSAAPSIFVGCRLSLGLALVLAVITEMIGNPQGLGYAVVSQSQALRPDLMFCAIFIIGLLGIILNAILLQVSRWLLPSVFRRPANQVLRS